MIFAYDLLPIDRHCSMTVYVAPAGRAFGAGAEATALFLEYLFTYFALNKVCLEVFEFNTPSLKLAQHLGFIVEGQLHQHRLFNGQFYDVVQLGLLRTEWDETCRRLGIPRLASAELEANPGRGARPRRRRPRTRTRTRQQESRPVAPVRPEPL